jgi:pimeloyl-ACP methyl ester carboxylesterase
MTTFALLHGAWHGAWCWERLIEPLRERGHRAIAVDLPCDDVEAGLDATADVAAGFLIDDDVIVVGHSLSGLVLPLVAARRPVRALVYLCAFVPLEGKSMGDQFREAPEPIVTFPVPPQGDAEGRSYWPDEAVARGSLYPDLSEEDAHWAFARLRAQAPTTQRETHPSGLPDARAVSLVCARDAVVNPEWSRRVARERLGHEPVELDAGHFPMLTAPDLLAGALDAVSSAA